MRPFLTVLIGLWLGALPVGVAHAQDDRDVVVPDGVVDDSGGLVIVVNDALDIPSIDDEELRRLFLGKSRRLPNGERAALASYGPEASFFNERMLGLSDAEVAETWARLRFSGRSPVPRTFDTPAGVAAFVARTPNALAYLPATAAREGTRVMTNLPR